MITDELSIYVWTGAYKKAKIFTTDYIGGKNSRVTISNYNDNDVVIKLLNAHYKHVIYVDKKNTDLVILEALRIAQVAKKCWIWDSTLNGYANAYNEMLNQYDTIEYFDDDINF